MGCENKSPRQAVRNDEDQGYKRQGNRSWEKLGGTGAATAIEWRTVREVVAEVVRSTLPEARAEAVTVAQTLQDGEVRNPVWGGAQTGDAYVHGGADDERSEPDGLVRQCRRRRRVVRASGRQQPRTG